MVGCFVSEPMQRNIPTRKRKELLPLDQVSEDLSDFSLSSPATKIRRLDAQLPPIMEEDEVELDLAQNNNAPELENQERAIVVFNPVNNPIFRNRSNVSISLSPDLVSGFKDQFVRSSYEYGMKCDNSEEEQDSRNQCTAVVPWVPSPLPPSQVFTQSDDRGEPMEDEETGEAAMEVEESSSTPAAGAGGGISNGYNGGIWASNGEGFLQWEQQHCMTPQPPQNISTPIIWFR